MNIDSDQNNQIVEHMGAACRVWKQMNGGEALLSIMAAALTLCEMAIDAEYASGAYLAQNILNMINERSPAQHGETIQ